ncbi:tRNA (guanosine(37)-N1)-methyltransferase TrmD [Patescibacteria group bacterium]|nr:tRNA (guanosine(37)-N1)-methyltransferase TrmD [Patescibacteria group bacterium]
MKLTFITIFPGVVEDFFKEGLLSKARRTNKIEVQTINPRDFTTDKHETIDDFPYGGGAAGTVMKVEPLVAAIRKATGKKKPKSCLVILLGPSKKVFDQRMAKKLTQYKHLVFVCGRYEGVDARVEKYVDTKISLGEFVIMGGEVAGLAMTEAIVRLLPGVIGNEGSLGEESYGSIFKLEYPHYTRPEVFEGRRVPRVLLSGDHGKIAAWRKKMSK